MRGLMSNLHIASWDHEPASAVFLISWRMFMQMVAIHLTRTDVNFEILSRLTSTESDDECEPHNIVERKTRFKCQMKIFSFAFIVGKPKTTKKTKISFPRKAHASPSSIIIFETHSRPRTIRIERDILGWWKFTTPFPHVDVDELGDVNLCRRDLNFKRWSRLLEPSKATEAICKSRETSLIGSFTSEHWSCRHGLF